MAFAEWDGKHSAIEALLPGYETDDVRPILVAELRWAIETGNYLVPASVVAKALMHSMLKSAA